MSTSNSKYLKYLLTVLPICWCWFTKVKFPKAVYKFFLTLIYYTEGLSTYFWIKRMLKQSPKVKTFRNVQQSFTNFHFGMFYKVLQYSIENFFNIRASCRVFFFPSRYFRLHNWTIHQFKVHEISRKANNIQKYIHLCNKSSCITLPLLKEKRV